MRDKRHMAPRLHLTGDAAADKLLSSSPLALLIGMVLDQQIPLEWAFRGPEELRSRLGAPLDAADIASMDPDKLAEVFSTKPALHRYPGSMAARIQALCQAIVDDFGGKADAIWRAAHDGDELYRRIKSLPGFGEMKAKIFIALLGKQCGSPRHGLGGGRPPTARPARAARSPTSSTPRASRRSAHSRRRRSRPPGREVTDLAERRLYLLHAGARRTWPPSWPCHRGRGRHRPAPRQAARGAQSCSHAAAVLPGVCATEASPSSSTTDPTSPSRWAPTACTSAKTMRRCRSARRILGPDAIVGLSTHADAELAEAAATRT